MAAFKKHFLVRVGLISFIAIFISSAGLVLAAWQEPQSAPPEGNPAAPLDVSEVPQSKAGSLTVTGRNNFVQAPTLMSGIGNGSRIQIFDSGLVFYHDRNFINGTIFSDQDGTKVRIGHNTEFNFKEEYVDGAHINPLFLIGSTAGFKFDTNDNKLKFSNDGEAWSDFSVNTWSKNGANVFYNDGNVGIGTDNPGSRLSINGNLNIVGGVVISSTTQVLSTTTLATASGNVGIGIAVPTAKLHLSGRQAIDGFSFGADLKIDAADPSYYMRIVPKIPRGGLTDYEFRIKNGNADEATAFIITGQKRIGIGTTTPGSNLSVIGGLAVGQTYAGQAAPANGAIFEGNVGIGTSTAPDLNFEVNGSAAVKGGSLALSKQLLSNDVNYFLLVEKGDVLRSREIEGINERCSLGNYGAFSDSSENTLQGNLPAYRLTGNHGKAAGYGCFDFYIANDINRKKIYEVERPTQDNPLFSGGELIFNDPSNNGTSFTIKNQIGSLQILSGGVDNIFQMKPENNRINYYLMSVNIADDSNVFAPLRMVFVERGNEPNDVQDQNAGGSYPYAVYAP